jgi:hypothetical protein
MSLAQRSPMSGTSVSPTSGTVAAPIYTPIVYPSPNVNQSTNSVHIAPKVVNKPTPTATPVNDEGSQKGDPGIYTPYNPHCYADCYPDLTQEKINWAVDPYQGSYETPSGPGTDPETRNEFKGLLDPERNHYLCEYFHVIGYSKAFKPCAGVN